MPKRDFLGFKIKIFIFSYYLCAPQHRFIAPMVKKELTEAEIAESIPDLWQPLTEAQRDYLAQNFTIQKYKKNEIIYCEGETPQYMMCLLNGKVKIYKDGVGGRSQIIRVIKNKEYFAYRAYFAHENFVTAAAAFEPCTMCLIPMTVITELVEQNTELAMYFIRQLSKDLGISDARTVNLTQNTSADDWRNRCCS